MGIAGVLQHSELMVNIVCKELFVVPVEKNEKLPTNLGLQLHVSV